VKIVSIIGARPEFIQAMPVSRALRMDHTEILIHTGQHYDYRMSQAFFDELEIPAPDYNLEVGSGTQACQTAEILIRLEKVLLKEQPDLVIVRGDTNSTLAGALATSKLHIPFAHIEAGERSFNRRMPEEVNRLVTDCLADFFFCVSEKAVKNLAREGVIESVYRVGDVMFDALKIMLPRAQQKSKILERLSLEPHRYTLVTVHRADNTDSPDRLNQIITALNRIPETVVFPVHPRTRKVIREIDTQLQDHILQIEPVGYYDMLVLESNAHMIATDSGGVQREAYYLEQPCITLRDETEWMEIVDTGWNRIAGADSVQILDAWFHFNLPTEHPPLYGDGSAAPRIAGILSQIFSSEGSLTKMDPFAWNNPLRMGDGLR